eukprot:5843285-Pyramimonas_sp.AAC.1
MPRRVSAREDRGCAGGSRCPEGGAEGVPARLRAPGLAPAGPGGFCRGRVSEARTFNRYFCDLCLGPPLPDPALLAW